METRANFVAIGFFTLLMTAVGFGFVYWIARYDDSRPMREMVVRFQGTVAGLSRGGQVLFNGIKVGEVTELKYDPTNPQFVMANLSVDAGIPLKHDTTVELSFQGLTGVGYVEMKGGDPKAPDLFDDKEIPELMAANSAFEDLLNGARTILKRTETVLKKVEEIVVVNESRVNNSFENVEVFTAALKNNADEIDTFLADASEAAKGLTSLSHRLEGLSDRADTLLAAVEPESVRKSVKNVEQFTDKLANASDKFDTVIDDAAAAAKGINAFSADLNKSLEKVDKLVAAVDPETVEGAVASLGSFAKSLDDSSEDIDVILGEAKLAAQNINQFSQTMSARSDDFNHIVTNAKDLATRLNAASKRIDGILGKVDNLLSDEEGGKGLIKEATLAARSIRKVSESFETRAAEISNGLARFSNTGLRNVDAMVGEARQTLRKLEATLSKLENDPSTVIFGGNRVKTYNRRH